MALDSGGPTLGSWFDYFVQFADVQFFLIYITMIEGRFIWFVL